MHRSNTDINERDGRHSETVVSIPPFFFFLNLAPESKYLMNKNKDSRFTPGEEFVENIGSYQTTVHTHTHIKPT